MSRVVVEMYRISWHVYFHVADLVHAIVKNVLHCLGKIARADPDVLDTQGNQLL
jgi:hypothetical protein